MSADLIQADYDQLENVADRFDQQADNTADMQSRIGQAVKALNGTWEGQGASAFFAEMDDIIFPALNRFQQALEAGGKTTRQIIEVVQAAEEEAAAPFRGGAAPITGYPGGSGSGSPGGGSPGGGSPGSGSGSSNGSSPGSSGAPAKPTSIWDRFEFKGSGGIWSQDKNAGGKFNPALGIKFGLKDQAVWGNPDGDGFSAVGGNAKFGLGYDPKDGFIAGAYGEYYTAQGKVDGVLGGSDLGLTGGATGKVLAADGFLGYKDGSVGASIGGTLVSAEGEVGVNVAGVNVGVKGEIGLKAELGFKIGKETEIKLPFITIGFSFGGAKK